MNRKLAIAQNAGNRSGGARILAQEEPTRKTYLFQHIRIVYRAFAFQYIPSVPKWMSQNTIHTFQKTIYIF